MEGRRWQGFSKERSRKETKRAESERTGRTRSRRFACGARFYATRCRHCDFAVMREHARANVPIPFPLRDVATRFCVSFSSLLPLHMSYTHLLAHLASFFSPGCSLHVYLFLSRLACTISFLRLCIVAYVSHFILCIKIFQDFHECDICTS